jgi:hypothetical protein
MTKPTAICLINATLDKTFLILFSKVIPPLNYNNLSIPCVYISFKKHIKMICIRLFSIRFYHKKVFSYRIDNFRKI